MQNRYRDVRSPLAMIASPSASLPSSLDLERAVLGIVLAGVHGQAMCNARQHVDSPGIFTAFEHQLIWLACLELDDVGVMPDAPAVVNLLARMPLADAGARLLEIRTANEACQPCSLWHSSTSSIHVPAFPVEGVAVEAAGGASAIYALADHPGAWSNLIHYASQLREYYLKRCLRSRLAQIADTALTTTTLDCLANQIDRVAQDLHYTCTAKQTRSLAQALDEVLEAQASVPLGGGDIVFTLHPGALYLVEAQPGAGKTSFGLSIAADVAAKGGRSQAVLYVSLGAPRIELARKLLAARALVPFRHLDMGTLTDDMRARVASVAPDLASWPLEFVESAQITVHDVRALVRRRAVDSEGRLCLLVVDGLQLLSPTASAVGDGAHLREIAQTLKRLAVECAIPILALSHLVPGTDRRGGCLRRVDLPGLRAFEPDADVVAFLNVVDARPDDQPDARRTVELDIVKNRFGCTGFLRMAYDPAFSRCEPVGAGASGGYPGTHGSDEAR